MKLLLLFMSSMILLGFIGAGNNSEIIFQKENYFPRLSGENLNGKKYSIPDDLSGSIKIIAVGFDRNHQEIINTWIPVLDNILDKENKIKLFELPIIYEMKYPGRIWLNNAMRIGIPDLKSRERTITIYTNRDFLIKELNLNITESYLFVINNRGKILWLTSGPATEVKIDFLKKLIEKYI